MLIYESSDLEGGGDDSIDEKDDNKIIKESNMFTSRNLIDQRLIGLASIMRKRKNKGEP